MQTNRDIIAVCRAVIAARETGKDEVTVNHVWFNLTDLGYCQRFARQIHEAATGKPMPGAACCAGRTFRNIKAMAKPLFAWRTWEMPWYAMFNQFEPGDYLYFSGGKACSTCGGEVGHVGIWDGAGGLYQNTSRSNLGTCIAPVTADQKDRLLGAFRFLPIADADAPEPVVTWEPGDTVKVILQEGDKGTMLTDKGRFDGSTVWVPVRMVEPLGYAVTPHPEQGKVYIVEASKP